MTGIPSVVEIRSVTAGLTRPLRQRVLRPHQSPAELLYPGDDAPGSFHLAAYQGDQLVGTVTLSPEERDERRPSGGSYRLRGMATAPEARGTGIGARLLRDALGRVSEQGGQRVWCNARLSAAGFYDRHGFARIGPAFDLPGIGAHVVMEIELE